MSDIRIVKASSYYRVLLDKMYKSYPNLANSSYREQYNSLIETGFGWADFWKKNLEETGDFIAEELIINAESMQKQWAHEHKVKYSAQHWVLDILEAQIHLYKPDVLFCHDFSFITPQFRLKIKQNHSNIKLIIGYDGIALNDVTRFNGVDLMLSCVDDTVAYYKQCGIDSLHLFLGFEEGLLKRIRPANLTYPVSFVGGISLAKGGHHNRLSLLKKLRDNIDIDLWISGCSLKHIVGSTLGIMKQPQKKILANHVKSAFNLMQLCRHNRGEVYGLDMYQILADSHVTINSHIDVARNTAANMRLFEATGIGTCLLTDWKENLGDIFVIDKEVVAYRTIDECVEKAKYLIGHPDVRQEIARAGQKRTLENYSFRKMTKTLSEYLKRRLS